MRPVWHPQVHKEYHEEFRVYGIRSPKYSEALSVLERFSRAGCSVYEVFGHLDFMLKGFFNTEDRTEIENRLIPALGYIAATYVMPDTSSEGNIRVLAGRRVPPLHRQALSDYPRPLLLQADEDWLSVDEGLRRELVAKGIVLREEEKPLGTENIRVFTFVGSAPVLGLNGIRGIGDQLEALPEVQPYLHGLYVGAVTAGFEGSVLLELSVPNDKFEEIIEIIRHVHRSCSIAEPKTQTFVAANIAHEGGDVCRFYETFDDIALRLGRAFHTLGGVSVNRRGALVPMIQQLEAYCQISPTERASRALILALISAEQPELEQAVAGIGKLLERTLGERLVAEAEAAWGDEWESKLAATVPLSSGKPLKAGWTLGEILESVRKWNEASMPEFLGEPRLVVLQDFVALRNSAIHQAAKNKRPFSTFSEQEIFAHCEHALSAVDWCVQGPRSG